MYKRQLFGYGKLVTEAQFLTMVLRLLQYEDDTDFTWNKSAELAEKLGLMTQTDLPLFGVMRRFRVPEGIRQAEEMARMVRKHPFYDMIRSGAGCFEIRSKQLEKQIRLTASAHSGDNLDHPVIP